MMEVCRTPSKEIQEIILANLTYEAVIDGLNGYFASEPRNDYITVKMEFDDFDDIKQDFALYEAEAWADILISWLRTEHGIFYYPGMEAKYAKSERIPPFTERMMDEGALNSLKKLHKRFTGKEPEVNSHTLIADGILHTVSVKDVQIEELKTHVDSLQEDRSFAILQDLYRDIFKRQPDGLSAEDIANKILDRILTTEDLLHKSVDSVNKECKATGRLMVDDYEKDLLQFICKEYKNRIRLSDETITYNPPSVRNTVLKIISDYARNRTRVDILETRIKSIFDRCKANFTVDDYVLNGDPTSSFMLDCISSWINSPAESRGKTRAEIENYKLKLKDYILKDIKKHGYRYDGLEKKSVEEIVDWIIEVATCARSGIALRDIYTTVASPVERRRYNIDNCDGEIVEHMKEYILRRFEGLRINTEYCLKKMSELDGCQKELKILEEQQEWLVKQNSELATKVSAKDDEISRLKDLINAMNEEVKDM